MPFLLKVVVKFLQKLFSRLVSLEPSDRATHFCNQQLKKVLKRLGVTHKLASPYHPRTSGQVQVVNREIKCILEKIVDSTRKEKRAHDKHLVAKELKKGDYMLLYNSRLCLFPRKLKSRWSGPFTVRKVFPYGTI